jgi:hypothetical protein
MASKVRILFAPAGSFYLADVLAKNAVDNMICRVSAAAFFFATTPCPPATFFRNCLTLKRLLLRKP